MANSITGVSTPNSAAVSTTTPTGSSKLGEHDFLKLLTAQLQNQDPLAPTDNSAFVAQLAQFSSLQEITGTNDRLDTLLMAQGSANQTATAGFIGKDVTFNSNQVALSATGGTMMATLGAAATKVTATISDSAGKVVRTIDLGSQSAGALSKGWNGLSDSGAQEPTGTYTVAFTATDAQGKDVTVTSQGRAKVTGVAYSSTGATTLIVNGVNVPLTSISEVNQASSTSTTP